MVIVTKRTQVTREREREDREEASAKPVLTGVAQAAQPPQSRLRNETFVMPIICSIGAIPTSSLLKNPMIQELRTQFSEAHGITNMHTIHVYEAFHFMKQVCSRPPVPLAPRARCVLKRGVLARERRARGEAGRTLAVTQRREDNKRDGKYERTYV